MFGWRNWPPCHAGSRPLRLQGEPRLYADKRGAFPHRACTDKPASTLLAPHRAGFRVDRLWLRGSRTFRSDRPLGWGSRVSPDLLAYLGSGRQALCVWSRRTPFSRNLPGDPGLRPHPQRIHPGRYIRCLKHPASRFFRASVCPVPSFCNLATEHHG
jgi:hypothetical protein